jgi:hypothetical protein
LGRFPLLNQALTSLLRRTSGHSFAGPESNFEVFENFRKFLEKLPSFLKNFQVFEKTLKNFQKL